MAKVNFEALTNQVVQEAVREAKGKVPPTVCQEWPDAKKVLKDISNAIDNKWAKLVFSILIAIGDGICPSR